MTGTSGLGGVGAGLSQAQFQMEWQVRVMKEQQRAVATQGTLALDLIRNATIIANAGTESHDLDIQA
jgi:hypothetical protein